MKKTTVLVFLGLGIVLPILAFAKIGVGVGTGKIQVDQPLKAGLIYTLPSFVVINTGDETAEYGTGIQYKEKQPELRPAKEWFSFKPSTFYLEPGQSQVVQIKLTLPVIGAKPGEYFAFLQGFPLNKNLVAGATSVGVAAAAKLYFTVSPANFFLGAYYRISSLLTFYSPWGYIILTIIIAAILIVVFRKFFSFNIGVSLKKK